MAKKTEKKNTEANASILKGVRMTEKAALGAEMKSVYVFNVEKGATKKNVSAAIKAEYKVTPLKVRLLAVPEKQVFIRGKRGVKQGGKKAYVYLKKGDKIEA